MPFWRASCRVPCSGWVRGIPLGSRVQDLLTTAANSKFACFVGVGVAIAIVNVRMCRMRQNWRMQGSGRQL
jgi:hypothetical protein